VRLTPRGGGGESVEGLSLPWKVGLPQGREGIKEKEKRSEKGRKKILMNWAKVCPRCAEIKNRSRKTKFTHSTIINVNIHVGFRVPVNSSHPQKGGGEEKRGNRLEGRLVGGRGVALGWIS